ncbi:MAG: glycosyltransferase family 2 protein [Hyphomicrobiales bacterium]
MRVSIVIPAYNEAGNIGRLVRETFKVMPPAITGEVIVVDDCSSDGTLEELRLLKGKHSRLRVIRHEVRSGQSTALRTGILAAKYRVIATMDGDGQNDPRDIPRLLELLGEPDGDGPALVGGIRTSRKATGSRRLASRFANWVRDTVLDDDCPDTGCGVKVFWRDAFLRLPFFTSIHRYLPAFMLSYGHELAFAPVNDRPRQAGVSKYSNLGRALIGLYDLFGVAWLRRRTAAPPAREVAAMRPNGGRARLRRARAKAGAAGPRRKRS